MGDKLPPIGEDADPTEKWVPKNWKKKDAKKMSNVQRSRYLAYEEAPKEITEQQDEARKRLRELKKQMNKGYDIDIEREEMEEKEKHEKLIGQLKAAEARNRIRIMRLRYEANRAQEVNHLIACQPTARKAVRLQALIPVRKEDKLGNGPLDKISKARVECLLEDNMGLITGRT